MMFARVTLIGYLCFILELDTEDALVGLWSNNKSIIHVCKYSIGMLVVI